MYRIYVRTHNQTVHHQTRTPSPIVAEAAFRELMRMRQFWATKSSAILTLDGRQLECRRFDRIVPVDADLADKLAKGEELPYWPRYIYPLERDKIENEAPAGHILCYLKPRVDTPFFDDEEPVRLFHDE